MTILAILTIIAAAISALFFRKGGIYNPLQAPTTPQDESFINNSNSTLQPPKIPVESRTPSQKVYDIAKACIGNHLTLDNTVPPEEGCSEALSYVLHAAGYKMPIAGIANVSAFVVWMNTQGFKEKISADPGDIIVAYKPGATTAYAHIGVVMQYGICSNTSYDVGNFKKGEWAENYSSIENWLGYFSAHGSITSFFEPV